LLSVGVTAEKKKELMNNEPFDAAYARCLGLEAPFFALLAIDATTPR
jgi:hypothetical protein